MILKRKIIKYKVEFNRTYGDSEGWCSHCKYNKPTDNGRNLLCRLKTTPINNVTIYSTCNHAISDDLVGRLKNYIYVIQKTNDK